MKAIEPINVRYIKLGAGGEWEPECINKGTLRFGYWTGVAEVHQMCLTRDWEAFAARLRQGASRGAATRATNEARYFFEDAATTLWVTFVGERLYWGFLEPGPPERHPDGVSVTRRVAGGWQWRDVKGEPLTKDRLSGALTRVVGYRGTSCSVAAAYVVQRINGRKIKEVEAAIKVRAAAHESIGQLMQLLNWQDFEVLVDLVFSASGWRRQNAVGKTRKTLDLSLVLPSTGETAFVQVKSSCSQADLETYAAKLGGDFGRMFFVYHTGAANSSDDRVTVLGPKEFAPLVLNAGLLDWLIDHTS